MISHDRFFDALSRSLSSSQQAAVAHLVIIGPGVTEPIDRFLSQFPQAQLTLVEVDHAALSKLMDRWGSHDCVEVAGELPLSAYDLAVIRHPDVARFPERWLATLTAVTELLTPNSLIILSAYSLPEAIFINEAFAKLPVSLLPGSPYTPLALDFQGNDRYILIFRKVL